MDIEHSVILASNLIKHVISNSICDTLENHVYASSGVCMRCTYYIQILVRVLWSNVFMSGLLFCRYKDALPAMGAHGRSDSHPASVSCVSAHGGNEAMCH